jgi:hypothetical protein
LQSSLSFEADAMKFSTKTSVPLLAASALTVSVAQAEDALYSHRLSKRGIDAEGNDNICQFVGIREHTVF